MKEARTTTSRMDDLLQPMPPSPSVRASCNKSMMVTFCRTESNGVFFKSSFILVSIYFVSHAKDVLFNRNVTQGRCLVKAGITSGDVRPPPPPPHCTVILIMIGFFFQHPMFHTLPHLEVGRSFTW